MTKATYRREELLGLWFQRAKSLSIVGEHDSRQVWPSEQQAESSHLKLPGMRQRDQLTCWESLKPQGLSLGIHFLQ